MGQLDISENVVENSSHCFRVHPRYKHDVGYRLSRSGLAIAYGQQVEFQGPIVESVAYSTGSRTDEYHLHCCIKY